MTNKLYFLTSRHGNCGTNVMFHNKDECGYGTNIDNLETYTAEEAQRHHNHYGRESLPLLVDKVKEKSFLSVDHQHMDNLEDPIGDKWIIQKTQKWNGNDVFWLSEDGLCYQDLNKARAFSKEDAFALMVGRQGFSVWPLQNMIKNARRVFDERDINIRSMCRGVKVQRKKRESAGFKGYRGNCPACGKFTYGSPYENEYCKDHNNAYDNPNYIGYQA